MLEAVCMMNKLGISTSQMPCPKVMVASCENMSEAYKAVSRAWLLDLSGSSANGGPALESLTVARDASAFRSTESSAWDVRHNSHQHSHQHHLVEYALSTIHLALCIPITRLGLRLLFADCCGIPTKLFRLTK